MKIVLDANIIIAALMGSRGTLTIITSQNHTFYAPRRIADEIYNHKQLICDRMGQTSEEFDDHFNALLFFINVLEYVKYELHMKIAKEAIVHRDLSDADYIACALVVGADFVWTNDKDFAAQNVVPTKTTDEFIHAYK